MRVIVDTNVFLSYLLARSPQSPPRRVVDAALDGRYELVIPQKVIDEMLERAQSKPYLVNRIDRDAVLALVAVIDAVATVVPGLEGVYPAVTRDRGDDFLFAVAASEGVDVLVSGDADVLMAGKDANVVVVTPGEFSALLDRITASG